MLWSSPGRPGLSARPTKQWRVMELVISHAENELCHKGIEAGERLRIYHSFVRKWSQDTKNCRDFAKLCTIRRSRLELVSSTKFRAVWYTKWTSKKLQKLWKMQGTYCIEINDVWYQCLWIHPRLLARSIVIDNTERWWEGTVKKGNGFPAILGGTLNRAPRNFTTYEKKLPAIDKDLHNIENVL